MPRKILIVDDYDDLASKLEKIFTASGHTVIKTESPEKATKLKKKERFDVVISDLDVNESTSAAKKSKSPNLRSKTRSFKILADGFSRDFNEAELKSIFEIILDSKSQFVDREPQVKCVSEKIEFVFPSALSLIYSILNYLINRVEKMGVVNAEKSNLFVALDEAFVNAVKHGNKFDSQKLVRITADISTKEARFVVEDEGEGFDVNAVPDPTIEENLLKSSGRGVLIIKKIMDEVSYNAKGNRLEMVKRLEK
ncbi:MAG: response regulator [Acidobacteria bacterium]|jgi:serine/threonine-protein kinase RsbW|nr:MAG: response regulator [Acidobacteriota bacterium]GIU81038.1 MAG: hypothetical protein KatS3mg006_0102 [Pyrinomonadaceae bacterium]